MAYLTPSRSSRNLPNRDGGIPELPTPPIGGGETGTLNGMNSRIEFQLLIKAAMRACDHHGDGPEARAEMSRECLATPKHLRADLLEHFVTAYPEGLNGSSWEQWPTGNSNRVHSLVHGFGKG